ncbi:MAG: sulfotransferase family 2 domain-containing protein [Pseudomonadota bacterium]
MIYSPEREYLFIHIPKTGGTSLALALEDKAKATDIMAGDTPKAVKRRRRLKGLPAKGRLWKHSTLRDLDGWLGTAELEPLYVFTIVRNPWDRLVSYYHWLRGQTFDHPAVALAQSLEFGAFLAHPHTDASLRAAPYTSYVTDADGTERCQRFIRFEHLVEDCAQLGRDLGLSLSLPHANRSERPRDYRISYDESSAQQVETLCQSDIARFGYSFDGRIG